MDTMSTVNIISIILGVVGGTGQIIASRRPVIGWTISLGLQPLWCVFYIAVGGYGLLLMSTYYGLAAFLNLRTAWRRRRAGQAPVQLCDHCRHETAAAASTAETTTG